MAQAGGVAFAATLLAAWLIANPHTPDLAAAAYRLNLFDHAGLAVYDEHWYAGHHLPGYSLLFPPLAWLLGLRVVAVLSVLVSVACFERLTVGAYGRPARWATGAFALAAVGDVWIGRLAFALGVSFALGALLALARGRSVAAGVLAALCAAASPVAGVLLALAALTHALARRSPRTLLVLAAPAAAVVVPVNLLFPEGGSQPYPIVSFAATVAVVATFMAALPREQRLLRAGGAIYLLACLVVLLVPTPMGSNVERYAVLLAGPLLACAVLSARARHDAAGVAGEARSEDGRPALESRGGARPMPVVVLALCAWVAWAGWGPLRETLAVAGNGSTRAAYYAPVERFLRAHARAPVRLEVPLTRSHWETAELAPRISLARGWEKQLDTRFDGVLLARDLTADAYARWLREQAVAYVALPDTKLDRSSAREGELIRAGLPYLREVFASRHWRVYAVRSPTPLLSGPGRLTSLGHESFALSASSPGSFLVRVRFTRYWTIAHGSGCVGRAPGGWTKVVARAPGRLVVRASFSLSRALGLAGSCHAARQA
ncbi:MAG TPA: hypothetical protein VK538_07015 [Solirubrobacteraceae bacterium]|nr:hypothetical protein [Solirubrobacteraceae bacterium]